MTRCNLLLQVFVTPVEKQSNMKRKKSHPLQHILIVFLLVMSVGSFLYVQNIELPPPDQKVNVQYAEDIEESEELMPDLHLIKHVMHKAMEFVMSTPPLL